MKRQIEVDAADSIFTPQDGAYEVPDTVDCVPMDSPRQSTVRESVMVEFHAAELLYDEDKRSYSGRIRTWPGLTLLAAVIALSVVLMTHFAMEARKTKQALSLAAQQRQYVIRTIGGGNTTNGTGIDIGPILVDTDGVVGNPKVYPTPKCGLPNYVSKNNKIYSVSASGAEVPLAIKGLNWFGMETGDAIPFGLWANDKNGTTAYQVAAFLAANKFNSIRLPVSIYNIANNVKPNKNMINVAANRAFDVSSYMALLKSVISTLAYRKISVLISLHTLTPKSSGGAWFSDEISKETFLAAVDTLTTNLCNAKFWNIIGLDLKNEPYESTWGDNGPKDFQAGATTIGNRMLKGCPQWLAFVEGVVGTHQVTIGSDTYAYYDWWGGGLQKAGASPVELSIPNKVVYAPHYYTPAVYPQTYLYGKGAVSGGNGVMIGYKELSDDDLRRNIAATMNDMFGYLTKQQDAALVLGEFGGLYATDKHPLKTTKRCTDFTLEVITSSGYAGGYIWSLNPESAYQYNPADQLGNFVEGVLNTDWLTINSDYLQGLKPFDAMPDLKMFPCFLEDST
ncbi:unnamed protein product [Aphanomyces euteiches]|uniref:Glycoside hydrolase family 5 domain-containing protein n=1 Tax=Aphanomyces euteiches TaxID=100861 RepID=A0A6G0XCQ8_9STRA|nr:hypothetical protein Ae201684_005989 [Aphanomyces euteiches]KAH9144874.1 hypothetical protein AeRB84_011195 [Aphanomyces euteiches]